MPSWRGRSPGLNWPAMRRLPAITQIFEAFADLLGPICWAVLIVLFIQAERFSAGLNLDGWRRIWLRLPAIYFWARSLGLCLAVEDLPNAIPADASKSTYAAPALLFVPVIDRPRTR